MEQTKAKATKFCLFAGILFLILGLHAVWTQMDNQKYYQEQIAYYEEQIEELEAMRFDAYDDEYFDALDDYNYAQERLEEYEDLAAAGSRWDAARVISLLPAIGMLLSAILLLTRRQGVLLAVGFLPLVVHWLLQAPNYAGFRMPVRSWVILLLWLLMYVLLMIAAVRREKSRKIWFLPTIAGAVILVLGLWYCFQLLRYGVYMSEIPWPTWDLLTVAAVTLAALWIAFPRQRTAEERQQAVSGGSSDAWTGYRPESWCGLVQHSLLLLFTFGIWNLVWIYRTTRTLNAVEDEAPRNPVTKLLLCMFIPFYSIYWTYRSAQRVDRMARGKGIPSELAGVCLLLAFFVPFVTPVLIQEKINTMVLWENPAPQAAAQPVADSTLSERLREWKQLLDDGVITQEEFDAKKRKALDL